MAHRKEEASHVARAISISSGTMFRVLLISLAVGFLFLIRDIIAMALVALLIAALIDPFADFFERWRIPRGLAVLLVYILGLSLLAGAIVLVVPPMMTELSELFTRFSPTLNQFAGGTFDLARVFEGGWSATLNDLIAVFRTSGVSDAASRLLSLLSSAFDVVLAVIIVLILAFYFVVEKTALVKAVSFLSPAEYQPFVMQLFGKMREKMGAWLRGQLVLMAAIFILIYGALVALGVPYALVLALLAGLLEIIPFVGPMIAAVPAIVLALSLSPWLALGTAGAYVVVQQLEGNILVPKIMQKAIGMNPIVSLLAILIGWQVGGIVGEQVGAIVGAMLSIPIAMAISVFMAEVFRARHDDDL